MAFWAVDIFWKMNEAGWSNRWYTQQAEPEDAREFGKVMAIATAQLMSNRVELGEIRVSDVDVEGDSAIFTGFQMVGQVDEAPNHPNVAMLFRLGVNALYRRSLYIHGIGIKSVVTANEDFLQPSVDFSGRASTFLAKFTKGFGGRGFPLIRVKARGAADNAWTRVAAIDTFALIQYRVNVDVLPTVPIPGGGNRPLVTGDLVQLSPTRGKPGMQGLMRVNVIDGLLLTIAGRNPISVPNLFQTYKIRAVGYRYLQIAKEFSSVERAVTHKVGRPFDSPRGRRN